MSDTPNRPDECKRLLDNGWGIVLFASGLGSYTAVALGRDRVEDVRASKAVRSAVKDIPDNQITDDFEPGQALTRLAAKVVGIDIDAKMRTAWRVAMPRRAA